MAAQAIIDDASRGCASEAGLGRLVVTLRPVLSLPEAASLDDTKCVVAAVCCSGRWSAERMPQSPFPLSAPPCVCASQKDSS